MSANPSSAPFAVSSTDLTHVVIELFGGDNNLSKFVLEDLQEMAAGNRGRFATLALADFRNAPGSVIEVSSAQGPRVVEALGEINTGDPETLAAFLARALTTYANVPHVAIGFWDHGSGVFDENDPDEVGLARALTAVPRYRRARSFPARRLFLKQPALIAHPGLRAMLHDDTNAGVLTNYEAAGVLRAAFDRANRKTPVDLIFSDTCLNGMIEVLDQLKPYTQTIVGSEELEPGDGWDYQEWFGAMTAAPPATAEDWARQAVEAFGAGYKNRPDQFPCTLAAFRTNHRISAAFCDLVKALRAGSNGAFVEAHAALLHTQAFARRDTFDIKDYATNLGRSASTALQTAASRLDKEFDAAQIASTALGPTVRRAHGLAFWFPRDEQSYASVAPTYQKLEFDRTAKWTAYLAEAAGWVVNEQAHRRAHRAAAAVPQADMRVFTAAPQCCPAAPAARLFPVVRWRITRVPTIKKEASH